MASLYKTLVQHVHHKVDSTAMGTATVAAIGVLAEVEDHRWIALVVEAAEALVALDLQSQSFSNLFDIE